MKRKATSEDLENLSVVLVAKDHLELQKRSVPRPLQPRDVLVQVKRVGICGSDVEYWRHGRIGDFILREPMVIGHESSGVVVETGEQVTHLNVGDRVALEPGISCGTCALCKGGQYNLCPEMRFFATPPVDGSLAQFVRHPAHLCFKLPESVSLDEGALCEPLAVGVHACRRAHVGQGSHVVIFGCGPIGIISMLVAKAFGATVVVMTDVREDRLKFASEMGAEAVVDVGKETGVDGIRGKLPNNMCDASIECCGLQSATISAIRVTRSGGTVVCVGLRDETMNLPLMDSNVREVDIRGIFRYANCYPACIALLEKGRVDNLTRLITHRFPMAKFLEGFQTAANPQSKAVKVMFEV